MNIGYVAFLPYGSPSVELRVIERAQAAQQFAGKELQFFVIGQPSNARAEPLANLHYIEVPKSYASYCRAQLARYRVIAQALSDFDLDTIVMRYAGADLSAMRFFRNRTVITEHHSNELEEGKATLRYKRGLGRHLKRLRYQLEKRYGDRTRSAAKGIIGVTEELRDLEIGRASRPPVSTVIPNGVHTRQITQTRFVPFDGKVLKLAFVGSVISSMNSPWHGVDRVLAGIGKYRGPVRIELHIVGRFDERLSQYMEGVASNVTLHGEKYGQELDELLGQMNLGLSTLALHRKSMQQACSLKTRDYTARGLPFVLAYDDPDLTGCAGGEEFFLKLPNDDSAIDMESLVHFAARMASSHDVSNRMRKYAYEHMDWDRKVRQLYEFAVAVTRGVGGEAGQEVLARQSLAGCGSGWQLGK